MKNLHRSFLTSVATLGALVVASTAHAEIPAGIQTAFDTASDDAVGVVTIVAGALVAFVAAMWILKAIRTGK